MKKIAIEEDFDGNLSSKTKTTKEMKRFGEIPPRLYFMPDVEVKNLQNMPLIPYKNLNLAVVNPDVNGEYLITKLLPKDDKPFYYNVRTTRDINEKNHLADFVFAKNNGNPFVNPKLYKFDLFFKDGVEDGIFYTTGINDMYEEVYRIMTNFDFYINTIFFKICDYAKMFSYIEEYLTNSNIVLNDFQSGIVKYNLTSKGFPYIVSLYIKMENFKRNKCTLDEAIKMDEFGYDDDLLENFRELIMKSTTVSWYGFKDSDPAEKAAYSEGQKHSNMFKKIFENEQPTFIFNYTEKKSVNALKAMYGSILLRVPKSVELDFILYVFVARNDICYDLSLITEVLKSAFLLTENNNVNYFDYLIDNDTPAITDKEQRLKYIDLFKKYAKGVKGFNSDLWQIKKVYEDAIYIYDYTLSNSDNRFVVVNRDSIKNIVYISNDVFIEPYQLNDGDYDGMQQETVIEKDENGQEVVLEQKTGIRLNKFNDVTGRSIMFSINCCGVPFSIILSKCSSIRDTSRSCTNITFDNVIVCYDRWFIQIPYSENDSTPYYKAKFIYSYKDDPEHGTLKSFVKLEINPGDSLKSGSIPNIDVISKGLNDLFQTVIIIPANLFGLCDISILPVERVDNSFLVKRDSFVLTYKFDQKFQPCMISLDQFEKDNKTTIYDMNEENNLSEKQLEGLRLLSVDNLTLEGDSMDSETLDLIFGDIGKNNERVIENIMEEEVKEIEEEEEVKEDFGNLLLSLAKKKKEESSAKRKKDESKPKKTVEIKKANVIKTLSKEQEDEIKKDLEQN